MARNMLTIGAFLALLFGTIFFVLWIFTASGCTVINKDVTVRVDGATPTGPISVTYHTTSAVTVTGNTISPETTADVPVSLIPSTQP